jgi:flagellar basal-body rod modification protein FlgD
MAITATTSTTGTTGSTPTFSTGTDRTAMDTNTFLKLLVAQLQYQDPSNPTDSSQFMSQTAQVTSVEKITELASLTQKVLDASNQQTGSSLVGKSVTYTDVNGASHTGTVTGCTIGSQAPNLTVDGATVALSAVTAVTTVTTAAAATTA